MTTTGTYNFNPSAGDVVMNAFRPCGVKRAELTTEHFEDAAYWAQMTAVNFSNRQPNLWQVADQDFTLSAGTATYTLPPETVAVSAVWLTSPNGDRILSPMSAVDYASQPRKDQAGTPTSYWFNLTSAPTITLWPVPTAAPVFGLKVKTCRQMQDVRLSGGYQIDAVYRFLEAFTLALAARLAMIYKPEAAAALNEASEGAFRLAAALDQERVPLNVRPSLSGYYSR